MNKHMAFSITVGLFAASAFAQQRIQTETVKGVAWSFSVSENGATITSGQKGKPAIPTSTGGDIAIPYKLGGNSVVAIGDDAFRGCTALTTVKIPMIVEGIGARAFYDCFSIKALELPRSCVSLGEQAFKGMTRMASITMKGGIAEIPDRLFQRCELLEEIVFPEGVEMLSGRVFEGCKKLHRVVFPKTLKTMDGGSEGDGIFGGVKGLREVVFKGKPPEMINVGLPPKCTVRYDEQFATAWQRWKNDNPSITAFSLQDANASPDAGGDGATASGEDSGDSDKSWLSIVETYVKPVTNENDAISRIEELATGNSDTNLAARWFALAKSFQPETSSENSSRKRMETIRTTVLRTTAAALICAGKSAVFKKEIAPQIDNLKDFEDSLRSPCEACGEGNVDDDDNIFSIYSNYDFGSGKVKTKCQNCHGSGRCPYQGCNGGYVEVRKRVWGGGTLGSESYSDGSRKCTSCNGSGQCRYCKGEGYLPITCSKCGGKGWVIKKKRLLAVYRKCAEKALDTARDAVKDKEREERRADSSSLELLGGSSLRDVFPRDRNFVKEHIRKNGNCRIVAITKTGGDVVVCGKNDWASNGCPKQLNNALRKVCGQDEKITDVCLTESGSYIVLYGVNSASWCGVPRGMEQMLRGYNLNGETLYSATFNDAGDWIAVSDEHYSCSDTWLKEWLADGARKFGILRAAAVSTDAAVAVYDNGFKFFGNVPEDLKAALRNATFDVRIVKIAGSAWFFADKTGYRYDYKM